MKNKKKIDNELIPISSIDFNREEFDRVVSNIDIQNFFNDLSKIQELENGLKEFLETSKEIVCLSSGTAAIHLALLLAGVKKDDYVLCPSFTYVASVNPILYIGAKPVFIDSNFEDWNLDLDLLDETILDLRKKNIHPKALIVVNNYGMPSDIVRLKRICGEFDIQLIEDAAESFGARFNGVQTGTQADFGIISFNNNKVFSTGGGGALICKDLEKKNKALYYANHSRAFGVDYTHKEVGYNYRLSNIQAALGLSQLSSLPSHIQKRKLIHHFYKELFKNIEGLQVFTEPTQAYQSNHWLSCVIIDSIESPFSKEDLYIALRQGSIETRYLWKPMHLQPVFVDSPFYGSGVAENLFANGLCLPSGSNLNQHEKNRIESVLNTIIRK